MKKTPQNNRKPFLLILIILIIFSIIFGVIIIKKNSNKGSSDGIWNGVMGNKINTNNKPKVEEKITSFLLQYNILQKHSINLVKAEILKEKGLLENKLIIENLRKYKEMIISSCNEVINGKKSLIIYDSELYHPYIKAREIIDKNEFNMFSLLINGECQNFSKTDQELCNIFKDKDLNKLETYNKDDTNYDYYLFKSIIQENNQCNLIKEKGESEDCTKSYQEFLSIKNSKIENGDNILANDEITNGKILNTIGKDKYLEKLNSQFLDECGKVISIN